MKHEPLFWLWVIAFAFAAYGIMARLDELGRAVS